MVTLPQQHCQKCVFQYTENDAMSYFHHRDICLGVGCGHAIIPKNTQSVCMFILSCVILHYDEFLTLFCILFVSGYHVGFIFCLQHLSGHLFYQHVSSITFFLPFLFTCLSIWQPVLPVPSSLCLCFCHSVCQSCGLSTFCSYCQLTCLQGLNNFSKVKFKISSSYLMTCSESFIGPLSNPKISSHFEIVSFSNFVSHFNFSLLK